MAETGTRPSDEDVTISVSDEWVVTTDEETGVTTQGRSRAEALENLIKALRLHHRPVPDEDDPEEPSDAPWFEKVPFQA